MTLNMATVHFILVHLRLSKCHLRSIIKQNSTVLHRLFLSGSNMHNHNSICTQKSIGYRNPFLFSYAKIPGEGGCKNKQNQFTLLNQNLYRFEGGKSGNNSRDHNSCQCADFKTTKPHSMINPQIKIILVFKIYHS